MAIGEAIVSDEKSKLERARRKVLALKGFYVHLVVFIVINTTLIVVKIVGTAYYGDTFMGLLGTLAPMPHGYFGESDLGFMP